MKVPWEWLRELCDPGLPLSEVEELLTLSGTKVEAIHHHGAGSPENFVVGKVLEAVQHPDADRLRVCKVDVGEAEPSTIVCGAPNVAGGQTVAVARPGAIMPGGVKLKKAKLRGVPSEGMILAEDELEIGADHAGIMVLDDAIAAGTPLAQVLPVSTEVIEFEITPNRPDCLGVYGIARELHAATEAPLAPAPWAQDPIAAGAGIDGIEIRIEAPDLCPRFTARAFEGITLGPSPAWLKARLMAAGMRPINNVVDITNYVMLATGHPTHAFDLDRIAGGRLVVRRAREGEQIDTLDEQTRTLDGEMLVIEDAEGPTSIAGVMGGARSEVHEGTTRILLEAATWIGHNIQRTSTRLGLRSEASGRFEKGLAPEQAMDAQALTSKLLIELCGARPAGGTIDVGPFAEEPWPAATLRLRSERVRGLLGMDIPRERQQQRLTALGFGVAEAPDGLDVTVPGFRRYDVTREADLVEEVGRFDLTALPATLPKRRGAAGRLPLDSKLRRRALDALVGRGANEIVGWSFADPTVSDRLRLAPEDPRRDTVALENPMSEDHAVLRTMLLPGLLDAARHNAARGMPDFVLAEQGAVFLKADVAGELPREPRTLGCLLHGDLSPAGWGPGTPPKAGFFTAKALLAAVLDTLRVQWSVRRAQEPFLHPGRAAAVVVGDREIGWIGELHPLVSGAWDLEGAAAFEIDLDVVVEHAVAVPRFRDLTTHPPTRIDLAVVVGEDTAADEVTGAIRGAGGKLLADARIFDVYEGAQVGDGRRSLAVALTFQAPDRTLTDEEVAPVREKIIAALAEQVGGELRG